MTDERLNRIIDLYGFKKQDLTEQFSYENFIYRVNHKNDHYFIRVSHSKYNSLDNVRAELDWIFYLQENGVSVISPIESRLGNKVEKVPFDDFYFIVVVFKKIEGQNFTENLDLLTPKLIMKWGKLLAKLHNLSTVYVPPDEKISRPHWDEEPLFKNINDTLDQHPKVLDNAKMVINQVSSLPKNPSVYGLIHQDFHEANVIINNGDLTIIDFDDCHYSWYVEDIAIILFHYAWRFQTQEISRQELIDKFFPIFMEGYLSERSLDRFWLEKIPIFVKLRHIRLFCTLAYELKIEHDEWSQSILEHWKPMLEYDDEWISLEQLI